MLLSENKPEIEKLLQKNDKMEDELDAAWLSVEHVKGKILQARDEGKDERVIRLQSDLDTAKSKAEIAELSFKKGEESLRLFLEKKLDAEVKDYPRKAAEHQNNIKVMTAEIGRHLKNALEIAKVCPGEAGASRSYIEDCLSKVSPAVLQGRADVDITALHELLAQGAEFALLRNITKNIVSKSDAINKLYGKAQRRDFE